MTSFCSLFGRIFGIDKIDRILDILHKENAKLIDYILDERNKNAELQQENKEICEYLIYLYSIIKSQNLNIDQQIIERIKEVQLKYPKLIRWRAE